MKLLVFALYAGTGWMLGDRSSGDPQWHAVRDPPTVETRMRGHADHFRMITVRD